ncbi:hypothetical protein ICN49_05670 [Polynucleobacter sp. MWH-Mekk-B1]|uniref:hypothetical protein n=1 Tax=Polynucleobacter finlandensis TaxID=1855894 RepID=UPI001C0DF264|nr:hypothetical protein [Polynucleobacter finlandensis]MBU3544404.1 hypothetical protein [Polynucleobacter finlandensis]
MTTLNYTETQERNKKRFKTLRLSFWGNMSVVPLFVVISMLPEDVQGFASLLVILFGCVCGITYLIMLGTLAAQARKNAFLWVFGAMIFSFIGVIVTYMKMKIIAIQNQWD